jgi:hypothetical protein
MNRSCSRRAGSAAGALAALACWSALGCGKSAGLPPTFAVTGKVVDKDRRPVAGATVHFQPTSGGEAVTASAETKADGTFALSTFKDRKRLPGAPVGSYRVRILLPMGADQQVNEVTLEGPFPVEARDNTFTLTLPVRAPAK